jgi:CheY-like chemotaxis protein
MTHDQPTLLIVDDEPLNLEIITEYLAHSPYRLTLASNGAQALEILKSNPQVDLVLLDRMMPGIDGIEVLKTIKKDPKLQILPVILQTASSHPEQVAEGLLNGAFYYLPKPFEQQVLKAVIETALRDRKAWLNVYKELSAASETLKLLTEGSFSYRTVEEAKALAVMLSRLCPYPETAYLGLNELLINAVEHGNLEITYDEKTMLINENRLVHEIETRLASDRYGSRSVKVKFQHLADLLTFIIEDQGRGFAWENYLEIDMSRILHNHGRGIAMSKKISFSKLEYIGYGNIVKASISLRAN